LKNPEIVILDEATSALDLHTEKRVLRNVQEFFEDSGHEGGFDRGGGGLPQSSGKGRGVLQNIQGE